MFWKPPRPQSSYTHTGTTGSIWRFVIRIQYIFQRRSIRMRGMRGHLSMYIFQSTQNWRNFERLTDTSIFWKLGSGFIHRPLQAVLAYLGSKRYLDRLLAMLWLKCSAHLAAKTKKESVDSETKVNIETEPESNLAENQIRVSRSGTVPLLKGVSVF